MHPCGLHLICGKKGGGKSMIALKICAKVIGESDRVLVTNLPIRKPEFAAYIHERWPKFDPATIDERVSIITDSKDLKKFWLTYGHGWWIPDVPKEEWNKGRMLDYREVYRWLPTTGTVRHRKPIRDLMPEEIENYCRSEPPEMERKLIEDMPPPQFAIDELQNLFPARYFQQTGHTCLFWLSQQRKLRADFLGICQVEDHVDKEFRDLADDRLYITNWGRKQKSFFRLPKVMTWAKYDTRPGPGVSPMMQGTFRIDVAGIGQCYDTSAGVGIEGGLDADTKERVGGIHWSWFLIGIVILLVTLFQVPGLMTKAIGHLMMRKTPPPALSTNAPATTNATQPRPVNTATSFFTNPTSPPPAPRPPPITNHITGIMIWSNTPTVYLSSGEALTPPNPRLGPLIPGPSGHPTGAVIDGQRLLLRSTTARF